MYTNISAAEASTVAFQNALVDTVSSVLGVKCTIQGYGAGSSTRRLLSDTNAMYTVDLISGYTPRNAIKRVEDSVTEEEFLKTLNKNGGLSIVKVITLSSVDATPTTQPTSIPLPVTASAQKSKGLKQLGMTFSDPYSYSLTLTLPLRLTLISIIIITVTVIIIILLLFLLLLSLLLLPLLLSLLSLLLLILLLSLFYYCFYYYHYCYYYHC